MCPPPPLLMGTQCDFLQRDAGAPSPPGCSPADPGGGWWWRFGRGGGVLGGGGGGGLGRGVVSTLPQVDTKPGMTPPECNSCRPHVATRPHVAARPPMVAGRSRPARAPPPLRGAHSGPDPLSPPETPLDRAGVRRGTAALFVSRTWGGEHPHCLTSCCPAAPSSPRASPVI